MPQGIVTILYTCQVAIIKACGKSGISHVQFLLKFCTDLASIPFPVNFQPHVQQVETIDKIANPASPIQIIRSGKNHILYLKGFR